MLIFFKKLVNGVLLRSLFGFLVEEVGRLIKAIRFLALGVDKGFLADSTESLFPASRGLFADVDTVEGAELICCANFFTSETRGVLAGGVSSLTMRPYAKNRSKGRLDYCNKTVKFNTEQKKKSKVTVNFIFACVRIQNIFKKFVLWRPGQNVPFDPLSVRACWE